MNEERRSLSEGGGVFMRGGPRNGKCEPVRAWRSERDSSAEARGVISHVFVIYHDYGKTQMYKN